MNNSLTKKGRAAFIVSIVFAVLTVAARIFLQFNRINPETGFYVKNDILVAVTVYGTYILAFVAYFAAFLFGKGATVVHGETPLMQKVFAIISAAAMAISAVTVFTVGFDGKTNTFMLIAVVAAVIAAVYFVTVTFCRKASMVAKILLCIAPIVFCAMTMLCLYFEISFVSNAPSKIIEEIALVSAMIFFLNDCRSEIERTKTGLLISSGFAAVIMISSSVIPDLVYLISNGTLIRPFLFSAFGEIGVLIYVLFRTGRNINCLKNN